MVPKIFSMLKRCHTYLIALSNPLLNSLSALIVGFPASLAVDESKMQREKCIAKDKLYVQFYHAILQRLYCTLCKYI